MNQLVRSVACTKSRHIRGKLLHARQQLFLAHEFRWACRNVNDAQAFSTRHNFCEQRIITTRKHVDVITEGNEVARNLGHIYILAAAVHAAGRCQGGRMIADKGNSSEHEARPVEEITEALVGAQVAACVSSPYTQQKEFNQHAANLKLR